MVSIDLQRQKLPFEPETGEAPNRMTWEEIYETSDAQPPPRHGHRAVAINDNIVVFGGGNGYIIDELYVYNTTKEKWFQPTMKGDIPVGYAAFGFVAIGTRIILFGGMQEYQRYSNEVFELEVTRWEWKRLPIVLAKGIAAPLPRFGHSFTFINGKIYMFGGLTNLTDDPKILQPRYLMDLYTLDLQPTGYAGYVRWESPSTNGPAPTARESHTAVGWSDGQQTKLIIYGGMSGDRMGDLWILDLDTMVWVKPVVNGIPPSPRSLHTATLIGNRMIVFGGWTPNADITVQTQLTQTLPPEAKWKCTNSLGCFNVATLTWEEIHPEPGNSPRPRAGHCAFAINSRVYIWSGRNGYQKDRNNPPNQLCHMDLWRLEVEKPGQAERIQMFRASTNSLELNWPSLPTANGYILQIEEYETSGNTSTENLNLKEDHTNTNASDPAIPASSYVLNSALNPPVQTTSTIKPSEASWTISRRPMGRPQGLRTAIARPPYQILPPAGSCNVRLTRPVMLAPAPHSVLGQTGPDLRGMTLSITTGVGNCPPRVQMVRYQPLPVMATPIRDALRMRFPQLQAGRFIISNPMQVRPPVSNVQTNQASSTISTNGSTAAGPFSGMQVLASAAAATPKLETHQMPMTGGILNTSNGNVFILPDGKIINIGGTVGSGSVGIGNHMVAQNSSAGPSRIRIMRVPPGMALHPRATGPITYMVPRGCGPRPPILLRRNSAPQRPAMEVPKTSVIPTTSEVVAPVRSSVIVRNSLTFPKPVMQSSTSTGTEQFQLAATQHISQMSASKDFEDPDEVNNKTTDSAQAAQDREENTDI